MYLNTEHHQQVVAASAKTPRLKTSSKNFTDRVQAKNSVILRHVFERLRESCGPWDGIRGNHCYKKSGMPVKLKWGGPQTPFDVHVLDWQMELVKAGLIEAGEVLSPASICMCMKWAITGQALGSLWKVNMMTRARRPAIQAGWLLHMDVIRLEKLNFDAVTTFDAVTEEPGEDVEP
jgi:hypothetical protein